MSRTRMLSGLLVAIVALGALSAYWVVSRDDRISSVERSEKSETDLNERGVGIVAGDTGTQNQARDAAAQKSRTPTTSATSTAPLPPLDTPLRTMVSALTERAESGDVRAKCRLAAEYAYCAGLEMRMKMIEGGVERAQNAAQDGRVGGRFGGPERMAEMFDRTSEQYTHCEGIDVPPAADIVRHMREAAIGGHVRAAGYYATGEMFHDSDTLNALSELSLYRDHAERLANQAIAQGDLRAAWALADAYASEAGDPRRSLLAQAVKPAPEKALSLLYGLRTSVGSAAMGAMPETRGRFENRLRERIASLEQRLPPDAVQRARSEPAPIGARTGGLAPNESFPGSGFQRWRGDFPRDFPRDICD